MGKFTELKVWQLGKELAVLTYKITDTGTISKDFGLKDQMRRAAISVPSNIAEGDELGTLNQSIKFLRIAKGSAAELLTQTIIAFEIGYLEFEQAETIKIKCTQISAMLEKLIQSRLKNNQTPKTL